MSVRGGWPNPCEVAEEPIRPLLVVAAAALDALELALDSDRLGGDAADPDPDRLPPEIGQWTAEIVSAQIDAMRRALDLYARALTHRHTLRVTSSSPRFDDGPL